MHNHLFPSWKVANINRSGSTVLYWFLALFPWVETKLTAVRNTAVSRLVNKGFSLHCDMNRNTKCTISRSVLQQKLLLLATKREHHVLDVLHRCPFLIGLQSSSLTLLTADSQAGKVLCCYITEVATAIQPLPFQGERHQPKLSCTAQRKRGWESGRCPAAPSVQNKQKPLGPKYTHLLLRLFWPEVVFWENRNQKAILLMWKRAK